MNGVRKDFMKFSRVFKRIFYLFFTSLFFTGATWWAFEKWVRIKGPLGEDHHPLQQLLLRVHGVIAYGVLLIIGYLIHAHIRPGLKNPKKYKLKTGWMMMIATSLLIFSSVMDLFGPEGVFHDVLVQVHWYLGLGFPVLLFVHLKARLTEIKQ